jgi:hypothetical protein
MIRLFRADWFVLVENEEARYLGHFDKTGRSKILENYFFRALIVENRFVPAMIDENHFFPAKIVWNYFYPSMMFENRFCLAIVGNYFFRSLRLSMIVENHFCHQRSDLVY